MRWLALCVGLTALSTGTASSTTIYSHSGEDLDSVFDEIRLGVPDTTVTSSTSAFALASSCSSHPSVVDVVGSTSIFELIDRLMTLLELNSSMGAFEIGTDASRFIGR